MIIVIQDHGLPCWRFVVNMNTANLLSTLAVPSKLAACPRGLKHCFYGDHDLTSTLPTCRILGIGVLQFFAGTEQAEN